MNNIPSPDIPNNQPRFKIAEREIDEVDRVYMNHLQAVKAPISIRLWAEICKIEEGYLVELVEKYQIPMIKGNSSENIPDKVTYLNILNTASKNSHKDIASVFIDKWKKRN